MAVDHLSKLPAELRLKIYGCLLPFDHPLRRAKKFDSAVTRVNTSILAVSKQIHDEAEDAFYELNTITLTFPEFYYAADGKVNRDPFAARPYRAFQLVVEKHMRQCNARRLLSVIQKASCASSETQLKSFTIRLMHQHPRYDELFPSLRFRCSDVGCYEVHAKSEEPTPLGSPPRIQIVFPDAVRAWQYFAALPSTHSHLTWGAEAPAELLDVVLTHEFLLAQMKQSIRAAFDAHPSQTRITSATVGQSWLERISGDIVQSLCA